MKTLLDGVYTEEQATRGRNFYGILCLNCHGAALQGVHAPRLVGTPFIDQWREAPLIPMYRFIKGNMPPDRVGGVSPLKDSEYMDVLAYILKVNEYPTGPSELTPETAEHVLIVGKSGPQPPPSGALTTTVGCLTQLPTGQWALTNATAPVRVVSSVITTDELKIAAAKGLGTMTIRLNEIDSVERFSPSTHSGQMMAAKGYYFGQENAERINLISISTAAPTCPKN